MVEFQGFRFTPQWCTLTSRPLQERCPHCVGRVAFQHLEVQEGDTGEAGNGAAKTSRSVQCRDHVAE